MECIKFHVPNYNVVKFGSRCGGLFIYELPRAIVICPFKKSMIIREVGHDPKLLRLADTTCKLVLIIYNVPRDKLVEFRYGQEDEKQWRVGVIAVEKKGMILRVLPETTCRHEQASKPMKWLSRTLCLEDDCHLA